MKAIVYTEYGSPDVLKYKEVEKPVPRDDEVLVKIYASSINDWDWGLLRGKPFVNRLISGLRKPKYKILGSDIAGKVEAVGSNVKQFQPGDEVLGDNCGSWGCYAEYVCAREKVLMLKPAGMTFDEAATIPQSALLALQGLRSLGEIRKGQRLLINGAGGGAGTFAVQLAKSFGAEVTGVDSTEKLRLMRSIGADSCLDYTKEDFTSHKECYDLILDFAAYHSIFDYRQVLNSKGTYVMAGGSPARIFQVMFLGPWISMTGKKKMGILFHQPNKYLALLLEYVKAGKLVPVIDRRYPLHNVAEGFRYFGEGHAKGKVLIHVAPVNK